NLTTPPVLYALSLHDALPICSVSSFSNASETSAPSSDSDSAAWIKLAMSSNDRSPLGAAASAVMIVVSNACRLPAGSVCRIFQRSEEHTSELQSRENLVCRLL